MKSRAGNRQLAITAGLSTVFAVLIGFTLLVRAEAGLEVIHEPHEQGAAITEQNLSDPQVVTDSSQNEIKIGLTYNGELIQFFGNISEPGADVVVILRSPAETVKLNQKGKVGPLWMNVKQHEVKNIPFMYKIHSSASLDQIVTPKLADKYNIGFDIIRQNMEVHTTKGETDPKDTDTIFDGIMALKKKDNLYKVDDNSRIKIKDGKLFSHFFSFPSAAKEGEYLVDTFIIKGGELLAKSTDTISVSKIGLESKLVHWANNYPKLYGVICVIIALSAGLLVGMVFKGGAH